MIHLITIAKFNLNVTIENSKLKSIIDNYSYNSSSDYFLDSVYSNYKALKNVKIFNIGTR